MTKTRVLMTGGGAPGAAGILKCLQQGGDIEIVVADANPDSVGKYLNPVFEIIPKATDAGFIPAIEKLCEKHSIDVVLPLVTRELFPLSAHKTDFAQKGVKIIVSNFEQLNIANNKGKLYQKLHENDILTPQFVIVETIIELQAAVQHLGYPEKTVCFKPCISNGMRGFRIIDDNKDEFDLLFNYKPTSEYIKLEKAIEILSTRAFPALLVSEYLPGEEYTIDCLAQNGKCLLAIPRLRKKMVQGISVAGIIENNEEIINYCRQIVECCQLHGPIGVQVKRANDGTFKVLEINPRVQGTTVALLGAGVNLPLLAVKQEMGETIVPETINIKWGTQFTRHWTEVYH
jgi:carbamoyl-phosphate synthase large subunit